MAIGEMQAYGEVRMIWESIATVSSGLFAGAALYVTLVEHPARVQCGTEIAVTEFGPSYHRAAVMQGLLAAIGLLGGAVAWMNGSGMSWLIGGLILGSAIPFTLVVILPTNKQLLDPTLDKKSTRAGELLARWARLHTVRSALGFAAFVVFACS
jgi:hypothetical protein